MRAASVVEARRSAVLAEARALDARIAAGEELPLAGTLVAVKDNTGVAGLPTTAAYAAYAYTPDVSASAVLRLLASGAIVLGKTNMDQFATGLVGTRSPHGPVRHALRPEKVSGGSSSGSDGPRPPPHRLGHHPARAGPPPGAPTGRRGDHRRTVDPLPRRLGHFLAALPAPLFLGRLELADGSWVLGFHTDPAAAEAGTDITAYGSWPAYLAERAGE